MPRAIVLSLVLLLSSLVCGPGCYSVTVERLRHPDTSPSWQQSMAAAGDVSPRTMQNLRQWDLDELYRHDRFDAFGRLQKLASTDPWPDRLYALTEISYLLGQNAERCNQPDAVSFYYLCAGYAYHYLFPNETAPSGYDPRFRLACDYYNQGLAKCLRAAQRFGWLDPGKELQLPLVGAGRFKLAVVQRGFTWRPDEFGSVLFCADFHVSGLENQYHGYGLGVPLIGTRPAGVCGPTNAFYPRDVSFPITAIMRFEGSIADLNAHQCGQVELYNPLGTQAVAIHGRNVPLETDLSTPLAYCLSHTELQGIQYSAFLRDDRLRRQTGIYMVEPYQPGKIPVLMVHGLLSTPLTWAQMFNELRADAAVRERFQFWFYLYPTSDPYLATAADLRRRLNALRDELDPAHRDLALDEMILVGHSMGGLVSKLMTVPSGDDFWKQVSGQPFQAVKAQPETRSELQQVFFFDSEPSVRRVIFIATPHRGSSLSPSFPARILSHLARLSQNLMSAVGDLRRENPHDIFAMQPGDIPTSIDLLAPGSPALELLAAKTPRPGVHYHSIIGVLPDEGFLIDSILPGGRSPKGTDGVVPYTSAHLDGVDSELTVPEDHMHVHWHPRSVDEVRRILLEHAADSSIRLVSHTDR
jgi:pimeloyl-ACP methyl ester carboxylesterase